jgi:hypothetical protein
MGTVRLIGEGYYGIDAAGVTVTPKVTEQVVRAFQASADKPAEAWMVRTIVVGQPAATAAPQTVTPAEAPVSTPETGE